MAELKGLMLSLSEIHTSPRACCSRPTGSCANLDSRSFMQDDLCRGDLDARTMTYARAAIPADVRAGPRLSHVDRSVRVLVPDGLVPA